MQTKKDEFMASVRGLISARSSGIPRLPQTAETRYRFVFSSFLDSIYRDVVGSNAWGITSSQRQGLDRVVYIGALLNL